MQPAIQDFYPGDFARCYGCGRLNEHGHQIKTRPDGTDTVTEFTPEEFHMALPGYIYGGLIASLIDCHSTGSAAIFATLAAGDAIAAGDSPRYVTAHLAVDYLAPTPLETVRIVGKLVEIKGRKVIVDSEFHAGGKVTARGHAVLVHVAESFGTA